MPLFHIHGLVAGILAPLSAGGEVYCTPGFNALKFFQWMRDYRPTWYTAVPSMHQAILLFAARSEAIIRTNPLRFLRSASAPMPPQVTRALESVFQAPLIEAYGMTEAAHQISSNPLPPGERRQGTVGIAAGPEIAIIDETGEFLPIGCQGEIVVRGANMMDGYANDEHADERSCIKNGWFRTGDQGQLTSENYLMITGRLKEVINRGGEKISPQEIDVIVMECADVFQCLTFAIPHRELGEDTAVAVVLREGSTIDEKALRSFISQRVASFKVPSKIVFLDEIPKGSTGKVQRIGFASLLNLDGLDRSW